MPFHRWTLDVALPLSGGDLVPHGVDVAEPSRQALAGQHREFAFGRASPGSSSFIHSSTWPRERSTCRVLNRPSL